MVRDKPRNIVQNFSYDEEKFTEVSDLHQNIRGLTVQRKACDRLIDHSRPSTESQGGNTEVFSK